MKGFAACRVVSAVTAVVVGASLGLTACGSSSKSHAGSAATTGGATGSSAAQAAGAPIKVGLMCTCSGTFGASLVAVADVYKAWVNTVNASGGLDGHPVKLTTEDDAGVPGTAVTDIQTLISGGMDVIADLSINDDAWASAVQSANIPVVGIDMAGAPFYTNPDFYPEGETEDADLESVVAVAKDAGVTNFGYLYCSEAAQCAESIPAVKSIAQKLNVSIAYSGAISATAPNYTAQCVAANQAHAGGLFVADSPQVLARVGSDCSVQNYKPIYLAEGAVVGDLVLKATGVKDNFVSPFSDLPYWVQNPALKAMNSAVDKYYPSLRGNANLWSQLTSSAWPSGLLLADAVKASGIGPSGTPSPAAIIKGLQSLKGDTLQGLAPPLTFPAGKPHPVDCWFTGGIKNGNLTVGNNAKTSCMQPSS